MNRVSLIVPVLCALLVSCGKDHYTSHDVEIKAEGYTDHGIELRFVAPPESLCYCPGLDLAYEGEKVRYLFVRSHIDRKPKVSAKAEPRGGELVAIVPFPPGEDRIELIDSSGRSLGAWEVTPSEQ